jgi:hypothetical protein
MRLAPCFFVYTLCLDPTLFPIFIDFYDECQGYVPGLLTKPRSFIRFRTEQAQFLREYKLVVVGGGGKLLLLQTPPSSSAAYPQVSENRR